MNTVYVHKAAYEKVRELSENFKRKVTTSIPIPLFSEAACFVLSVNPTKTKHEGTLGLKTQARKGAKKEEIALYMPSCMGCRNVHSSEVLNLLPPIMTALSYLRTKKKDSTEHLVTRTVEGYEVSGGTYQMRLLRHGAVDLPLRVGTQYTSYVKLPFPIVTGRLSSADYGLAYNYCAQTNKVSLILAAKCGPYPHKIAWQTLIPTGTFTERSLSESSSVLLCVLPLTDFLRLFIPVCRKPEIRFFLFLIILEIDTLVLSPHSSGRLGPGPTLR